MPQTQGKQPMSRFLKTAGDTSSSSLSSSSEEESSDDEPAPAPQRPQPSKFLKVARQMGDSSDSDSEDERKVVKSAKDKRIEEMQTIQKAIDNALKIGDWVATSTGA